MRFARGLLVFSCGLFTLGAQTLLFREFLAAFEGNDISVGVFFGAWFLWIGLGAVLVRRWGRLADWLLAHIESLFLLYLPAYAAQLLLILHVRDLAGVASYDLMSVPMIVVWATAVNAPVSVVTGALFPVACRWIEQTSSFPVSRVYILEAVGSFAGGLGVTALLAYHVHTVLVFCFLAVVLLVSIGFAGLRRAGNAHRFRRTGACASLLLAALFVVGIATGIDAFIGEYLGAMKWTRLLPREALAGSFATAQAEYLYGRYHGQWIVMREGSVCEALPNEEEAGRTAALALCQNPPARRVLVIGAGLAVCQHFLLLPQMEELAWAHPDGEYIRWLLRHTPAEFRIADERLHPVESEIRRYLAAEKQHFDLVIVNLPEATGSTFNRYYTTEFYERLKTSLRPGGVVGVGIAGGEDVMGAELVSLGASVRKTLEQVFSHLVLVPGEQTWLVASDGGHLTSDPALLRDRFAAIEDSQRIFPPAGLLSVYQPQKAALALQAYDKADLPPTLLINRDARPLTHLYSLLLAARQSGASVTRLVKLLAMSGWLPFLVPVLVFATLRGWALAAPQRGGGGTGFDSSFLVFSTGWVGIASVVILMYAYETRFGSLYLHVGLISSLFMAGLTIGALVCSVLVRAYRSHGTSLSPCGDSAGDREPTEETPGGVTTSSHPAALLLLLLLVHGFILAVLAFWLGAAGADWRFGHVAFAAAFVLCGLCCGVYWPLAAAQLSREGLTSTEAGSRLETADHLGACLGSLATSLLAVPVLGTPAALLLLAALLLANVPAATMNLWRREPAGLPNASPRLTDTGYALLGAAACVVLCSNLLAHAGARLQPSLPESAVRTLAGEKLTQGVSATLKDTGKRVTYLTVAEPDGKPAGYLLSSADFAPEVRGFGGRLNLALHLDPSGALVDFLLVRSNETPSYLDLLHGWLDSLKGQPLFGDAPLPRIHAVTGATISSRAVLEALQTSARRFSEDALGGPAAIQASAPARAWMRLMPDRTALYLVAAFAAAFLVARWGGRRSRNIVLILTLVAGGIALNAQYSSEQIATLLTFETPAAGPTGVFLLAVGVPLLVLLLGNLYCGYVCPFGAAQELLGYILPRRFRPAPLPDEMRPARFIKYLLLAVLILAFFLSRDRRTLAGDPLTSVFGLRSAAFAWPGWLYGVLGIALAGSLFYVRFWCRYLCPVGAFLSLVGRIRVLHAALPPKWFGQCEFGLTATDHLDCLQCDRCRHLAQALPAPAQTSRRTVRRPLVLAAVAGGLFVASVPLGQFRRIMPQVLEQSVPTAAVAGQPRDLDIQRIRTLIDQHQLSDHKAEYYQQVE